MIFDFKVPCCMSDSTQCACGEEERVLRHYASGANLPAMTSAQREWAISEAVQSAEGSLNESECSAMSDMELASATLRAWKDYAVSQGLY